ncbi:TlpA family protein disulfide reductase [Arthrobacter sp. 35W]|uniref:TlpA family protein disulfide reductase n=1 Tax=Arthrobacter sp. 35W TaxID=1132441 RepID=UPI0004006E30|nr:TlpA disulfide reductase family protein [Arthrobacter sp. 35W]
MRNQITRRSLLAASGALAALALSACTAKDPLAQQANAGDNKNYIAGDGSVTEYGAADRKEPVQFSGTLFDGTTVASADLPGGVTVLNFWYAACAPCRVEAPDLQALHEEFTPQGAKFYGVNIRDEAATAEAFERNFGLTYPSMADKDGGVLLALTKYVPPAAVPTTLVLDKKGRVSARILGLADKGTLKALITSALAEN